MPITITGHLKDNQGNIVQGSVVFQLVNYSGDNPRVSGTNIIVSIQTTVSADTAGFFTASIQGNDTIIPSGTYYQVTYRNALGKPATIVSYSFTGAGPINLDTQAVLNPPPSPPSPATLDQTYIRIDGSNIGGPTSGQYARGTGTVFATSAIQAADLPVFGASGVSHSKGAVPDPGSIAGTTKFLREDATWQTVSAGGVTSVFTRTGAVVAVFGDYTAAQVTNAQDNSVSQAQNTVHAAPSGSAGVPTFRLLVASDIPSLDTSKFTTGILALARGGNTFSLLGDLIYGGVAAAPTVLPGNTTATQNFLRQTGTGAVSAAPVWATLVAGDIPSLDVSKITTGQLALARGGTHADLSATGGTNRVLKQSSVGADITVAVLVAADIPVFVASGASHAPGGVPDPGAGAGTTKFLREDATFAVPPGSGGTRTIRVPIDIRNPRESSLQGNAFWTVVGLTAWDAGHWEFVAAVDGKVYGVVPIPNHLATTPNASIIFVGAANNTAASKAVRLQVSTKPVASGATFDQATLTAETAQNVSVPTTARQRFDTTFTLTNAPTANDILIVEIFRVGSNGGDTLTTINFELYEAWLQVDVND